MIAMIPRLWLDRIWPIHKTVQRNYRANAIQYSMKTFDLQDVAWNYCKNTQKCNGKSLVSQASCHGWITRVYGVVVTKVLAGTAEDAVFRGSTSTSCCVCSVEFQAFRSAVSDVLMIRCITIRWRWFHLVNRAGSLATEATSCANSI